MACPAWWRWSCAAVASVAQGAAGVRSVTSSVPVTLADPFVIGSCGKAMTATIAARLAYGGVIWFEATLEQVFPELAPAMQPAYRTATLAMLLAHRSGIPQAPPVPLPLQGDPATERARALPVLLSLPPQGIPGQSYLYSNFGYIVAGAMLERVAGVPFEQLAATQLFQPLGLATAGSAHPSARCRRATPPSGCRCRRTPTSTHLGAAPAGLFHLSLPEWARFARPAVLMAMNILASTPSFATGRSRSSPLMGPAAISGGRRLANDGGECQRRRPELLSGTGAPPVAPLLSKVGPLRCSGCGLHLVEPVKPKDHGRPEV